MKKINSNQLQDNNIQKNYVEESRKGNKTAQRHLFDYLVYVGRTIQYRFYYSAKKVGLTLRDLDEEYSHSFMQLLKNYKEEKGSVENYFKFLYFNRLRTVVRRGASFTRTLEVLAIGLNNDLYDNESNITGINYDENKKTIDDIELSKIILGPDSKVIDEGEKVIFELYIQSYTFTEMSKLAKMKYGDCIKKFKSGKRKIRIYLKNINIEKDEVDC